LDLAVRHALRSNPASAPPPSRFLFDHLTFPVVAPRAPVDVVNEFVAWLQQEAGEIPKL
jgi:hypothetical protein